MWLLEVVEFDSEIGYPVCVSPDLDKLKDYKARLIQAVKSNQDRLEKIHKELEVWGKKNRKPKHPRPKVKRLEGMTPEEARLNDLPAYMTWKDSLHEKDEWYRTDGMMEDFDDYTGKLRAFELELEKKYPMSPDQEEVKDIIPYDLDDESLEEMFRIAEVKELT